MLITPSLLHVKTRVGRGRQETAVALRPVSRDPSYAVDGLMVEEVLGRLDVPVMLTGPEMTEWQCIREDHAAMAAAGEWADVLDALRFADQDRTLASGGCRVAPLISEGVRARGTDALRRGDIAGAEAELRRFEAVFELNPEDPAAAHLVARARIDIGLARRDLAAGLAPQSAFAESDRHFDAAEAILDSFDPIAEMSPLLAETRFLLVGGIEDGPALCRDWYEDWCDLAPGDDAPHVAHATQLMAAFAADLTGALAAFEKAALRATRKSRPVTGDAAYAVYHMAALTAHGELLPTVDLVLFLSGLGDYAAATGCQHRANLVAQLLTRLMRDYRQAGPDAAYALTKVRAALSDVLWNRLHEIHLDRWEDGADRLAFALGEVFGPALLRGARIIRKGEGLATRVPRSL